MERHRSGRGYGAGSRIRGCAHYAAAQRGALASLIRSAGTSEHRFAHTGSMIRNGQVPTIPGIAIANADADTLAYAAGSESPVTIRIHSTARQLPDLSGLASELRRCLEQLGFQVSPQVSPVVAVTIKDRNQAIAWWQELLQRGAYVNLVMPPASPTSDSLLRCSVSAAHSSEQIDRIIDAFAALQPDSTAAAD